MSNIYVAVLMTALVILSVVIFAKVNKDCGEGFGVLFPEPDMRRLKGSFDCAYGLNGGNVAKCNEWLDSYRKGELCRIDRDQICCEKALSCCNQIATCGKGKDCRNKNYMPTKLNKLVYDDDYVNDQ